MAKGHFSAIILAAGFSYRMGQLKPLARIGSRSMIDHAITVFEDCAIDEVIVVLGHRAEEIRPELSGYGCRTVQNKHYEKGMFSSMQVGIKALKPQCKAFFILPVDIPLVKKETINQLVSNFHDDSDICVYYPQYQKKRGHPPLIHSRLIDLILDYSGENGMRGFLSQYEEHNRIIPVNDPFILKDSDNTEDLAILEKMHHEDTIDTT